MTLPTPLLYFIQLESQFYEFYSTLSVLSHLCYAKRECAQKRKRPRDSDSEFCFDNVCKFQL